MPTWKGQLHHHSNRVSNDQHALRSYGDVVECRKVLQLAINSVTEDIDSLYDYLMQLEQDKG